MRQPIKLAEEVAPNLVPMVDIMFLLLLFFMLSADMGQRQLEVVKLPKADSATDDTLNTSGATRLVINLYHREEPRCGAHDFGFCRADDHWKIGLHGLEYSRLENLDKRLADEARAFEMAGGCSELPVMIRADEGTPYGKVQQVLDRCAHAGLFKVEVGAALPVAKR